MSSQHLKKHASHESAKTEFTFFKFLNNIVKSNIQQSLDSPHVILVDESIDIGIELLDTVRRRNVYSMTNDQLGKAQLDYLKDVASGLVALAESFNGRMNL